jgi:hypothetical protein
MNYLKSCTASAYAPPAAPKATVCGAKLTALNGEVQRLLVTVLVLGVITAEYWSDLVGGLVRDWLMITRFSRRVRNCSVLAQKRVSQY